MQATATFHAATLGRELPDWVDRGDNWREVGVAYWREAVGLWATAALAKPRDDEALHWLEQAAQRFAALEARSDTHRQVLLHRDIRSDNLRWRQSHLYLLDWPAVMPGNPEEDLAAFAQSITLEGGPPPEQLVGHFLWA